MKKLMTAEELLDSRMAAQRNVLLKAHQDPQFRALLKSDPVAALKSVGVNWDPSVRLEVIEETESRAVIVLPPPIQIQEAANDDELSDDDLERVAAGNTQAAPPVCFTNRFGVEQCGVGNNGGSGT